MSQKAVESTLGRLMTDAEFREQFAEQPAAVCRNCGLDLTSSELSALLSLDMGLLEGVSANLDPRIVRAATVTPLHALGDDGKSAKPMVRRTRAVRRQRA